MQPTNPYDSPTAAQGPVPLDSPLDRLQIKTIEPISVGKVLGALYAIIGLFFGGFMSLFTLMGVAVGGADGVIVGILGSLFTLVLVPLFYGAIGLIGGIIVAFLYNLAAGWVGGIELRVGR